MATETVSEPPTILPVGYPYHIGKRIVLHKNANGEIIGHHYLPMSEEDFLHPEEVDQFETSNWHRRVEQDLYHATELGCRRMPDVYGFRRQRMDWQSDAVRPHGLDFAIFSGYSEAWDPTLETLPIRDLGGKPIALFEVTSPATRHIDFGLKFSEYAMVGVPYYLIVDLAAPTGLVELLGYYLDDGVYAPMTRDESLGYWIPELKLWFRWHAMSVVAADENGDDIPNSKQLVDQFLALKTMHAETARADALATELAELKAKLNEAK